MAGLHGNARVDGKIYCMPFHNSAPLLYYNTDAFKEVGLDPDHPPQTCSEWAEAAHKLTKRDGDRVTRWGLMMSGTYDILGWVMTALMRDLRNAVAIGGAAADPPERQFE